MIQQGRVRVNHSHKRVTLFYYPSMIAHSQYDTAGKGESESQPQECHIMLLSEYDTTTGLIQQGRVRVNHKSVTLLYYFSMIARQVWWDLTDRSSVGAQVYLGGFDDTHVWKLFFFSRKTVYPFIIILHIHYITLLYTVQCTMYCTCPYLLSSSHLKHA